MIGNEPLISIIVPVYNLGELVISTLDSICAQTYKNLEVVVVDDGSIDNTSTVIDEYSKQDGRIKIIHKKNGGVTSARLAGIEASKGDWIGFVDGDDIIDADMYEHLMKNAIDYEADISHCGYEMVFPSGRSDYYYNTGRLAVQNNIDGLKDIVSGMVYEPALWNKIFKKQLFSKMAENNLMDRSIKINEDLLMNFWLFQECQKSVFEDFCPYHYIVRKNSAANSSLNEYNLLDPLKVVKIIYENANDDVIKNIAFSRVLHQLINLSSMSPKIDPKLIKPNRKKARKELRSNLKRALLSNIGIKLKIMSLWVAIAPSTFDWIHRIHGVVSGNSKKYDLD